MLSRTPSATSRSAGPTSEASHPSGAWRTSSSQPNSRPRRPHRLPPHGDHRPRRVAAGTRARRSGQVSAPGASRVNNFADRVLRNRIDRAEEPAAYSIWQGRIMEQLTWGTLASDVADCRNSMLRLGVSPGDRIVAQMATGSAALTAFFAAASIGAVWSTVPVGDNLLEVLRDPERTAPKVVFCV